MTAYSLQAPSLPHTDNRGAIPHSFGDGGGDDGDRVGGERREEMMIVYVVDNGISPTTSTYPPIASAAPRPYLYYKGMGENTSCSLGGRSSIEIILLSL